MKRCLSLMLSICMIIGVLSSLAVYAATPLEPVNGWYGYSNIDHVTSGTNGTTSTVEVFNDQQRGEVMKISKPVSTNEYTNWRFPIFATYELEEALPLSSDTPVIVEFWIKSQGKVIEGSPWGNAVVHLNDIPFLILNDSNSISTRAADSYGMPFFEDGTTVQDNEWCKFRLEIKNTGTEDTPVIKIKPHYKKNEKDDWVARTNHWQGDTAELKTFEHYGEAPFTELESISVGYSMNYDTSWQGSMRKPVADGTLSIFMDDLTVSDGTPIVSVTDSVDMQKVPKDKGTMAISFSENVIGANSNNIKLYDVTAGASVSTSGTYEKNVYTMTMPELTYGHDYEIRFNKDEIYNNAFGAPLPIKTDAIPFKVELEPTYVASSTPAAEATNVALSNNTIVLNFNKPVDDSTLEENITVTQSNDDGNTDVTYTGVYDEATYKYTMTLDIPTLGDDCKYTIKVKDGVETEDGSEFIGSEFGFYSATERPRATITNISMDNGATMVPVSGKNITVTFSKDMDQSTITKDNVKVIKTATGETVSNYSLSYANKVLTVSFTSPLENLTEYKLEVSKNIKDAEYGKLMFVGEERVFTTIDTTPVVTSLTFNGVEVDGELQNTEVTSNNVVKITFDKDMVFDTLSGVSIVNTDTGAVLNYVPEYENKVLTLNVTSLIDFASAYEIIIPNTLKSVNDVNTNESRYGISTTAWVVNDSFDEAANIGAQPANWQKEGTTNSNLTIENFDNRLVAKYSGTAGNANNIKRTFPSVGGKVVVSFDWYVPKALPAAVIMSFNGNRTSNIIQSERGGNMILDGIGWNQRGHIILDDWNTFKIVIDTETDCATFYINGKLAVADLYLNGDVSYVSSFECYWYNFFTEGDLSTLYYLDNFKVSQESKARLIGAMASGTDVLQTGTAANDNNELTLEFSNALNAKTINNSSIKLLRDGVEVPYKGSYDNKKYTYKMTLGELFIADANYTIVLSDELKSKKGESIKGDTEFSFVGVSRFEGIVIDEMSLSGNNLTIEGYSEKGNIPVKLVVAKYNDKKMTYSRIYDLLIPEDTSAVSITQIIEAGLAEGETLKAMIWSEKNVSYANPVVK